MRPEIEERERELFPARSRAAKKMARIEALRKLRHAGYDVSKEQAKRLGVLISVVEDQQRGLPHEHVACPHTSALEIAFTRAFFDALPPRSASSPTRAHRPLPIRDREAGQVSSAAVPRLSSESLRATWPNPCPPASSCESITASAFSTSRPGYLNSRASHLPSLGYVATSGPHVRVTAVCQEFRHV